MKSTGGVVRGCGTRVKGGIYAEVPMGPNGKPIEYFLVDPPIPITEPDTWGFSPVGVSLIQQHGVYHVIDWVGSQHYPNVLDIVEETRRHGLSRRLPRTLDFAKLSPDSKIILVHARAALTNPAVLYDEIAREQATYAGAAGMRCPKTPPLHAGAFWTHGDQTCAGAWWETVTGGSLTNDPADPPRCIERTIGSTTYRARQAPAAVARAIAYCPAIFAALPLAQIAVVRGENHQQGVEVASKAGGIPVHEVDE